MTPSDPQSDDRNDAKQPEENCESESKPPAESEIYDRWIGRCIDKFTIRKRIGEGGFGIVFLAEQEAPVKRNVALKMIKPGMDSRQVLARFQLEQQSLAMMDHPGIAKVLGSGTTESGQPYFVMEWVPGHTLVDYCNQLRLPTRKRLELFVDVCRAVHHAHQKGVIHRDLKPSNILVRVENETVQPTIIDFGMAKALHFQSADHSIYTRYSALIGTPLYMSPEQADSQTRNVDTRSDIYSLGVILYELLTGTTPFHQRELDRVSRKEFLRMIREQEPLKPSSRISRSGDQSEKIADQRSTGTSRLSRTIRGDLDWIVLRALEKEPARRYESANAFAEDLTRFLNHDEVQARPPSGFYRFRKLVRKNRSALAAAATVLSVLIAGSAISLWQTQQANLAIQLRNELNRNPARPCYKKRSFDVKFRSRPTWRSNQGRPGRSTSPA